MALVAAAPANMNGDLMKPKIELDRAPEVFSNVLSPTQAAQIRQIMSRVVNESGGTARRVVGIVGTDFTVGGKTGTAQKQVPVYDPKTNKPKTITIKRRNRKTGAIVEVTKTVMQKRVDGWFICIAPLENSKLSIAVVVENIGNSSGGSTAAPIAANMIVKARQLGLMGEELRPQTIQQPTGNTNRPPKRRRR